MIIIGNKIVKTHFFQNMNPRTQFSTVLPVVPFWAMGRLGEEATIDSLSCGPTQADKGLN